MPCQTVNVEEPTPDVSSISINIDSVTSPSPNTVSVDYTVSNVVTSGSGETLSPTIETTVGGSQVDTTGVSVGSGGSESVSLQIDNVSGGSSEVCVREV